MRVPTLQAARQSLEGIAARKSDQARLQARIAGGVRVQTPSDDPLAAAQAELARARIARLDQASRTAGLAAGLQAAADAALGRGTDVLASARDALVAAGNAALSGADRRALALQLRAARAGLAEVANSSDGAGGHVFAGQGIDGQPLDQAAGPAFASLAGEQAIGEGIAATLDGRALFSALPQGNGVFVTASAPGNTGDGWIGGGSVTDPSRLTGHAYAIAIGGTTDAPTATVTDGATGATVFAGPFVAGQDITVDGQRVRVSGNPSPGDRFTLQPAGRQGVFTTLDDAIALLEGNGSAAARSEGLERAIVNVDRALEAMGAARTRNGEAMRALDAAVQAGEDEKAAATTRRSALRDLDLPSAITELQQVQLAHDAALQAYAAHARKSLFDLIG